MKSRVQKWGNSLALRIPRAYAAELDLKDGSPVAISVEEGAMIIKPDRDRIFDLDSLLGAITDENIHPGWEADSVSNGGNADGGEGNGE